MATRVYETALDDATHEVTEGVGSAITAGKLVQVTVDLAVGATEREVILALERIERYIREDIFPPA